MIQALKDYGVPRKYCRLVAKIYERAAVQVRIQEASGERLLSRPIPVRRGAIQGDIPSAMYFLVALDKLLKDHGGNVSSGIVLTPTLVLKDLEYADDAALPDKQVNNASERLTHLSEKGE